MPVQQLELLRGQRSAVVGVLAVAITARVECKVTGDNDHANRWVSDTMVRSASYNARAAWWWTSTSCSSAFLAVTALLQSAMFMDLAILLYSVLLQCKQARFICWLVSHGVASVLQDHAPLRRLIMT